MSNDQLIQTYAIPFESGDDLQQLVDDIGDAKIVLLGEASHGTAEFYTIRAELTKKLITEKSFSIIAVEGDWPACQQVNHYIKSNDKHEVLDLKNTFQTWPNWMWANEEVATLVDWLKAYNERTGLKKVGFYGVDLYSLSESMEILLKELTQLNLPAAGLNEIKQVLACFQPYKNNEEQYALSTINASTTCTSQVFKLAQAIKKNYDFYPHDEEVNLNLLMNATIIRNAEAYYRASTERNSLSWNIRDTHMTETINQLLNYHGNESKIIVWAHNTHIGDASATTMKNDGSINVGQLLREQNDKKDVYAIGFGTYSGTVIAANDWGNPFEIMKVPPAQKGSWEDLLHKAGAFNKYLLFNEENRNHFNTWIDHRAIGVTYDATYERFNYVPSQISNRYDAFIHLDRTTALRTY